MILAFRLSMPRVGSWNGHWSGEGHNYVLVRSVGRSTKAQENAISLLANPYYRFSFGDRWAAAVTVTEVNRNEAAKLRRTSDGFCGYDWMVKSLLRYGEIRASRVESTT